ncbi:MAG: type IV secretory system conjugative DNA transfer family protein, partial [bacterium]
MTRSWCGCQDILLGRYGPWFLPLHLKLRRKTVQTHWHCIGISGSGKSRFLAGLYLGLLRAGLSATLVDPHGDLARLVLAHLVAEGYFRQPDAYERLLYLDLPAAERAGRFFPFNVLNQNGPPHTIASNIMEAMHRAWPALSGGSAPMFDTLVQNGVKVLVSNGLPLPALYRFLIDKEFRDELLAAEPDPDIVAVFHHWYDRLPVRDQLDQSGSTLRRVGLLIFDPVLKYSLAQRETLLNFRGILDQNRSVIVNLALYNAEARRLLGCLLTVGAEHGALSRAELPPESRLTSHHLVIDEFSEFTAQSEEALSRMLSQTRKYGLYLVMAHQTWSQASERLRGALQNVGLEVVFKLGRQDAQYTAPLLGRVDPLSVKHEVADTGALERTHPVFYSLGE